MDHENYKVSSLFDGSKLNNWFRTKFRIETLLDEPDLLNVTKKEILAETQDEAEETIFKLQEKKYKSLF